MILTTAALGVLAVSGFFVYQISTIPRPSNPEEKNVGAQQTTKEKLMPPTKSQPPQPTITVDEVKMDSPPKEMPKSEVDVSPGYPTRGQSTAQSSENLSTLKTLCDKKNFKIAFTFLTKDGADTQHLEKLDKIKQRVASDFQYATENLATLDTSYPVITIRYDSLKSVDAVGNYSGTEVTKEFYKSNPDEFDFIATYTDLDKWGDIAFGKIISYLRGIQSKESFQKYDSSEYHGSNHRLVGFLNLGSVKERFPGVDSEENVIRGRSSGFLHELGHNWCCYVGDPYKVIGGKLRIIDEHYHWNPYFDHGPSPLAIHSSRTYWRDEGDGIFSSSIGFEQYRVKYHPFMLYFMGLKKPEEITEKFKVIAPEGSEWFDENAKKVFVKGQVNYITIRDIVDVAGPRICTY